MWLQLQAWAVGHVELTATAIFSKAVWWRHAVSDPDYIDGTDKKRKEEEAAAAKLNAAILTFICN